MAGTAIRLSALVLNDGWPGPVNPNAGVPSNGWDNTSDNFTRTAATDSPSYPIGTKVMAYTDNTNCPGWYTMMYLGFHDFSSQDISYGSVCAGKGVCAHTNSVACGSKVVDSIDNTIAPYYYVSRCTTGTSDVSMGSPICFPCASMQGDSSIVLVSQDNREAGYGDAFGWFWVGGVCPCKDATFLDNTGGDFKGADISVDTLMRVGPVMADISSDGVIFLSADTSNMIDATSLAASQIPFAIGWSCMSEGI